MKRGQGGFYSNKTKNQKMLTETDLTTYRPDVLRFAMRLTRDEHQAQDLTQVVMLKAWRFRDRFAAGNVKGWLMQITKNAFITEYRRIRQLPELVDVTKSWSIGYEAPDDISDEMTYALSQITSEQRMLLQMRMDGYRYQEIAQVMEIPVGTVKTKIHHMRKALKNFLKTRK